MPLNPHAYITHLSKVLLLLCAYITHLIKVLLSSELGQREKMHLDL
jgi:hypothetical protein